MGKYNEFVRTDREAAKRKKAIHPVWRGIGFILVIIVPYFAYISAQKIFDQNWTQHWFPIPNDILTTWGGDPYIFVKLLIALVIIVAISAVLMFLVFVGNALFGPPRYGPLDSPPIRKSEKPHYTTRRR
jgi:NADH:ubiquinone oxidoreductase subunit 5 (subunit L)/multisubunit Na+/H+ antiporter MnhA subunit